MPGHIIGINGLKEAPNPAAGFQIKTANININMVIPSHTRMVWFQRCVSPINAWFLGGLLGLSIIQLPLSSITVLTININNSTTIVL